MFVLSGIGNRSWGWGGWRYGRWVGVFLMTMGIVTTNPTPLWAWPAIAALVFFFRVWPTRYYFHTFQYNQWRNAYIRSLAFVPLALFMAWLHRDGYVPAIVPLILAPLSVWLIPHIYFWTWFPVQRYNARLAPGKEKIDATAVAEVLVGLLVGATGF